MYMNCICMCIVTTTSTTTYCDNFYSNEVSVTVWLIYMLSMSHTELPYLLYRVCDVRIF